MPNSASRFGDPFGTRFGTRFGGSLASVSIPAPVNTVSPSITGTPQIGTALTGVEGTWTGEAPIVLTHQWQRSDDGATGWADIAAATALNYTPVSADGDKYLRRVETATNPGGATPANTTAAKVNIAVFTVTTTGANQTLTLQSFGVSASTTIEWGDTQENAYTGTSQRTHVYASAGTYALRVLQPRLVTVFDLRDAKASCVAGEIGGLTNLTSLYLNNVAEVTVGAGEIGGLTNLASLNLLNVAGATIGAGEIGGLTNLTSLYLLNVAGVTIGAGEIGGLTNPTSLTLFNVAGATISAGEIGGLTSLITLYLNNVAGVTVGAGEIGGLTNLTSLTLLNVAGVTVGAGEIGGLTNLTSLTLFNVAGVALPTGLANLLKLVTLQYENTLSQANVDSVLAQLYAAFPTRTGTNGTIDLFGGSNAAPSGVLQAQCPPTTGKEFAYELANDSCGVSLKHWTSITTEA